ncbi:MAG: hypothetical protein TRG1_811 [Flavobacteriaceae bacterium FS1-H7996/R]|nr:MAG: hypothetical protein TRG1_811 [Flavobacteriaceae bacterium FS1-H7996/R]
MGLNFPFFMSVTNCFTSSKIEKIQIINSKTQYLYFSRFGI